MSPWPHATLQHDLKTNNDAPVGPAGDENCEVRIEQRWLLRKLSWSGGSLGQRIAESQVRDTVATGQWTDFAGQRCFDFGRPSAELGSHQSPLPTWLFEASFEESNRLGVWAHNATQIWWLKTGGKFGGHIHQPKNANRGAWCSQLLAAGEDRKVRVYTPGSGARLRWLLGARHTAFQITRPFALSSLWLSGDLVRKSVHDSKFGLFTHKHTSHESRKRGLQCNWRQIYLVVVWWYCEAVLDPHFAVASC